MKRPSQDVAGRPKGRSGRRPDVAGSPISRTASDVVARHCDVLLHTPLSSFADEAGLISDFADFLAGDEGFEAGSPNAPDPVFMERFRRRLWRHYIVSHRRNAGRATH